MLSPVLYGRTWFLHCLLDRPHVYPPFGRFTGITNFIPGVKTSPEVRSYTSSPLLYLLVPADQNIPRDSSGITQLDFVFGFAIQPASFIAEIQLRMRARLLTVFDYYTNTLHSPLFN